MSGARIWTVMVVVGLFASAASAEDCCDRCGCKANCCKVCRVVCETKKVPKTIYTCECEDFCVPRRSKKCGCTGECECGGPCKPNFVPTCAKVHTRTKLVKHIEEDEVKTYKWVVEYVCEECGCAADEGAAEQEPEQASPPEVQAKQDPTKVKKVTFLESLFGGR